MTPQQRAKMDELVEKYASSIDGLSDGAIVVAKNHFTHGFTAALEMQNAEVEFDEGLADKEAQTYQRINGHQTSVYRHFMSGARWQHSQDAAKQISQLQAQRDDYERAWKETQQARVELAQQIAQLQQEIVQLKQNILAYKMREWSDEDTKEELAASQEREKVLREALKFYAEPMHYTHCWRSDLEEFVPAESEGTSEIEYYKFKRAKEALAEVEAKHGKS